jgi:radical SAM superfamily enzyme YgiQ (UPF0313 family)
MGLKAAESLNLGMKTPPILYCITTMDEKFKLWYNMGGDFMNITLVAIDAKYIHTNNAVRLLEVNSSFEMNILEYTIKDPVEKIVKGIVDTNPYVIGFSVYIWNVEMVKQVLPLLEQNRYKIVLGGPEVSYDPKYFLNIPNVNFIVRGEGEVVFDQFLTRIQNNASLDDLHNIAYYKKNQLIIKPIVEIAHLESLKSPHFRMEDIPHIPNRISYVEASRGCPYKCSYCLSSLEKKVRFFPLDQVLNTLTYLVKNKAKTIKFLDRTFNANKKTMEILHHIITIDRGYTVFQFEITGDILQDEVIDFIHTQARPGLFRFEIGIQSTNDYTNMLVDRKQDTKKLFEHVLKIQKENIIDLHLDLIAGLPKEDKASFIKTFNDAYKLGAKELQLGFLKMLRGTKLRKQAALYDYIFDEYAPYEMIKNDCLSEEDVAEIKLVEHMLELYHNKGYFKENLKNIIINKPSPYHFFLEIGKHYQNNNYRMISYQIKDVYLRLFDLLNEQERYLVLQDYLTRSKIKPERFYQDTTSKGQRLQILEHISKESNIPLHILFKHSVLITYKSEYFCTLYQNQTCQVFKGKAPF